MEVLRYSAGEVEVALASRSLEPARPLPPELLLQLSFALDDCVVAGGLTLEHTMYDVCACFLPQHNVPSQRLGRDALN